MSITHGVCRRAVAVVLVAACLAGAASREERLATFLAGCEVIHHSALASPDRKAAALQWLIGHTGITPASARSMLDEYRGKPQELRRLLEAVRTAMLPPQAKPRQTPDTSRGGPDGT
jgi:hypothetical protein